jgi:signal transduction histidine kinase
MKILKMIDVTKHILYSEYKEKHQLTSMINACVSHELRNPLNSIIAKNYEKEALYQQLKELMGTFQEESRKSESFKGCLQILD